MKQILYILAILLTACASPQPVPPVVGAPEADIELSVLNNPYVDLSEYGGQIILAGHYKGPRLVFRNASGKTLLFRKAVLESEHEEDALCFAGDVSTIRIEGSDWRANGAITFWGRLQNATITGLHSEGAHTGIRATGNYRHEDIRIEGNVIRLTSHEGVYIGPSQRGEPSKNVRIRSNRFEEIGWDAAQLGNCDNCYIEYNHISRAGQAREYGQDYAITLNRCGIVYLTGNVIELTPKRVQSIETARVFWHEPDKL